MKPHRINHKLSSDGRRAVHALTLLELLIVVAILAILTTVASRSLFQVGEQVQFDANQDLAKNFRLALLGPSGALQSDGTPSVSGFIADLGRPPRAQLEMPYPTGETVSGGSSNAYTIRELVANSSSPPFNSYGTDSTNVTALTKAYYLATQTITLYDATNRLTFGWRGPYMTGGSDSVLVDGWNKPLAANTATIYRSLIDFWVTYYDSTVPASLINNPFTFSMSGYQSMDVLLPTPNGKFWYDVVGIAIRPGPAAVNNVYTSTALANYTTSYSAGVVFDNEYTAQLGCILNYNSSALVGTSFATTANYWWTAGVIIYSPNPHYGSPQFTSSSALTKPVAVSCQATTNLISVTGPSSSTYPTAQTLTITKNIIDGAPNAAASYPLIQGPKVVKPFLVAVLKTGSNGSGTNWYGTARNIVLRPGYNTVQLTVP